jgi:NAD(P)-dependent dehydrogenase (short-subunit alcohol dehydrogenase family)
MRQFLLCIYLRDEEPDAKEVIALINAEGRMGVALPGDLRDAAFCEKLVDDAVKALGGLDILVNNAGRQQQAQSISDITYEAFDATMRTNIHATFLLTKAALKHLKPGSALTLTREAQSDQHFDRAFD